MAYTLQKNDDADSKTLIDINAIPDKYNDLFEELFNGLKSL